MDLTQLWQSISLESIELAAAVEHLPDECECGDADAHLQGRCLCCTRHDQIGGHNGSGLNCNALIARLQADLAMLSEDLTLAGPPTEAAALEEQRVELRRRVFLAASDLQQTVEAFKKVSESVAGFRLDCAVSRMRAIKRHSAELREHCERVNAELQQHLLVSA
ncbi:MAG TPA: hypothetical protein VNS63_10000 [Blastocatellia bacterium]|nr:hypothetical protein [Blastocatellia bacterium]